MVSRPWLWLPFLFAFLPWSLSGEARSGPASLMMGSLEIATNSSWEVKRWRSFSRKYDREKAVYEMCGGEGSLCSPRLREWRQMLEDLEGASAFDQITSRPRCQEPSP